MASCVRSQSRRRARLKNGDWRADRCFLISSLAGIFNFYFCPVFCFLCAKDLRRTPPEKADQGQFWHKSHIKELQTRVFGDLRETKGRKRVLPSIHPSVPQVKYLATLRVVRRYSRYISTAVQEYAPVPACLLTWLLPGYIDFALVPSFPRYSLFPNPTLRRHFPSLSPPQLLQFIHKKSHSSSISRSRRQDRNKIPKTFHPVALLSPLLLALLALLPLLSLRTQGDRRKGTGRDYSIPLILSSVRHQTHGQSENKRLSHNTCSHHGFGIIKRLRSKKAKKKGTRVRSRKKNYFRIPETITRSDLCRVVLCQSYTEYLLILETAIPKKRHSADQTETQISWLPSPPPH